MKLGVSHRLAMGAIACLAVALAACADDSYSTLAVGSEVYSNVTVTSVTATDIYFTHSRGLGNAKLKSLDRELQKRYQFNAAKAGAVETNQVLGNAQFREDFTKRLQSVPKPPAEPEAVPGADNDEDLVVPKLYAKSFRGQPPPQVIVEQWLTPPSDPTGKFVLVDFWATWCGPCKQSIPHLNALHARFKDRVVVVGLSNEPLEALRKMTTPRIDYAVGTDPHGRTLAAVGVQGIPHALLIDPKGIVRFEGIPGYLSEEALARLIAKYGE